MLMLMFFINESFFIIYSFIFIFHMWRLKRFNFLLRNKKNEKNKDKLWIECK